MLMIIIFIIKTLNITISILNFEFKSYYDIKKMNKKV